MPEGCTVVTKKGCSINKALIKKIIMYWAPTPILAPCIVYIKVVVQIYNGTHSLLSGYLFVKLVKVLAKQKKGCPGRLKGATVFTVF